uniref:Reverse transcriptase domain-containing protein n=1 Tax=Tanacetum cinerariifolium TaxID=118510 RepID=A0A6L2KSF6_TANCI|nr:hypothetical protein [Tanacetum cinerariifolium]
MAMESVNFPKPPPLIETPEKQNLNKFRDYHGDRGQRIGNQGRNGVKVINIIREKGNRKRPFKEGRSGLMNELTFSKPQYQHPVKAQKVRDSDDSFFKETYHPLGIMDLRVTMGNEGRSKTVLIEFAIIKCCSPYNVIIERAVMRSLKAVGSTIHSMIKLPTNQGIVTMKTSREALRECKHMERIQGPWKEQTTIGEHFMGKHGGIRMDRIRKNNCSTIRHGASIEDEGLIKTVQHPERVTNAIPIKLANGTWKVKMDYSNLNKVYPKDVYPFPEEGKELASLMGY